MNKIVVIIASLALATKSGAFSASLDRCSYSYTIWNTKQRKSAGKINVSKSRQELTLEERGPLGCTPCSEDQRELVLPNGARFKVCFKIAQAVQNALEAALKDGFVIASVVGYRPQKSRGAINSSGHRTQFSNHSYGVALDINETHNGLYENCFHWSSVCRLIKGGSYDSKHPLSIKPGGSLVRYLRSIGLLWGGEIKGKQKDFMHFSPTGY